MIVTFFMLQNLICFFFCICKYQPDHYTPIQNTDLRKLFQDYRDTKTGKDSDPQSDFNKAKKQRLAEFNKAQYERVAEFKKSQKKKAEEF